MESPFIFSMEEGNTVIVGPEYIALHVTPNETEQYLKNLKQDEHAILQTANGKILTYATVDEITSKQNETAIDIGRTQNEGYVIDTITLPNLAERDQCIKLMHQYLGPKYSYTVQPQKIFDAILLPLIGLILSLVGGSLLTWFCQTVQEPLHRTHIVKAWVSYFYHICKLIGPMVPLMLTCVLSIVSLIFLVKQSLHRPIVILIEKKNNVI